MVPNNLKQVSRCLESITFEMNSSCNSWELGSISCEDIKRSRDFDSSCVS